MVSWKTAYRSFYYDGAPEPPDPILEKGKVALLVIDVQNTANRYVSWVLVASTVAADTLGAT